MHNFHESQLFRETYEDARQLFVETANKNEYELTTYTYNEEHAISCDVAHKIVDCDTVLVTISGVHGIEGFCGSAIQNHLLRTLNGHTLSQIHVHSLNAWGMKFFSRTNEDHIDVNRNFIDFSQPLPINLDYDLIHDRVNLINWNSETKKDFEIFLQEFIKTHGLKTWNKAFSGGQYQYPDGIAFGGCQPTRSNQILNKILEFIPSHSKSIVILDFHTGIGKFGEALGLVQYKGEQGWLQDFLNTSKISNILIQDNDNLPMSPSHFSGSVINFFHTMLLKNTLCIVFEYGTYDPLKMIKAIIYDNWSRHRDKAKGLLERQNLLALYCPTDEIWRAKVITHVEEFTQRLLNSLEISRTISPPS